MKTLFRLYDLRTLVLIAATLLAFVIHRPLELMILDSWIFQLAGQADNADVAAFLQSTPVGRSAISQFIDNSLPVENFSQYWPALIDWSGIGLVCCFLVLGLSRCSLAWGAVALVFLAAALLGVQASLWLVKDIWLPLGAVVTFALLGYGMMLFWLLPQQQIQQLEQQRHELAIGLARLQLQQGNSKAALATLGLCFVDRETLALVYQVAQQQERKREYAEAMESYQLIAGHDDKFKDVAERLTQLQTLAGETPFADTLALQQTAPLARTLALADKTAAVARPVLGRYELQRELGRGAMGIVYLGLDPKISRQVAIKTLHYAQFESTRLEELRERFFREAEAAGRLNHPNIVTVFDVGEETDLAYIAMDYIQGKPLDRYCRPDQLLPVETTYDIVAQVAEALAYAHARKIVHRDIKPSNLLFNPEHRQVKVTDFGIARISDESRTRTGQVMGSPLYMSPEQLKGKKLNGAADIFSLGVTFYQLLTGHTPFSADSLPELTLQVLNKKHRSVRDIRPDIPPSAVRITNKALQKDPARRFRSAADMAKQLRKALMTDFKTEVA